MYADDIRKDLANQGYERDFIRRMTSCGLIARLAKAIRDGDKAVQDELHREISREHEEFKKHFPD